MFISKEGVPISDDEGNTIWIWEELPHGPAAKVLSAITSVDVATGKVRFDMGEYTNALVVNSVLRWEGPKFRNEQGQQIARTPENIARFNRNDPLYKQLVEEVTERNPLGGLAAMMSSISAGSTSSDTPTESTNPTNGTSTSPVLKRTTGRQNK